MVNFIEKGKKALTVGVTVTTIAWTLGLSALAPASALTLTAGDLIQASGKAVYWFTSAGNRMPFPNEKVYKSWFTDFSGVKKITDAELAAIPLATGAGANVTYRPGTRLVKITTDPKTYAVEPGGSLRWIKTEADAKALYGDNWGNWIDDVPDVFFTNYTIGAELSPAMLTNGRVVKTAASSDLYVIWEGKSRKVADYAAFTANRFNSANVGTVAASLLSALPVGTPVTGAEAALTMPAAAAMGTPAAAPAAPGGKNLTVSAEGTPAAATHASGTAYNDALKLKLTAGSDGDVKVTQLVVNRGGFAADSAFTGVGAFDLSTGKRHGNFVTFSDQKATIPMASDPLVVPAGKSLEVMLRTNVTSAAAGQTGTYNLSVLPAGITTTATVSAPAPLMGATEALTSGANSIANLNVDVVSLSTTTVSVDIGQKNYELTRFRFSQANGNNDVYLKKLTLFNNGTATDDDLTNFTLVDLVTGLEISKVEHSTGRWLTFDMSAKPYLLKKGTQRDLAVKVTFTSGSSRTAQLVIQNDYDIEATSGADATTGTGILAGAIGTTDLSGPPIGDITTGSSGFNHATINAGTLSLEKDTKSPAGLVGIGASNVLVATWKVEARGEAIELQRSDFSMTGTGLAAGDFTGSIRLLVSDVANDTSGQSLYTVTPGNAAGVFDGDAAGTDQVTYSSYYTIEANKTAYIKLVVDTSSTLAATDTIVGNLSNVYFRRVLTNTYATASSGTFVGGNTMQASAAALAVSRDASLASKSIVEGQSDVPLGSFYFQTGSTEGVNVSSIAFRLTLTDAVDATSLTNLKLWLQDPDKPTDAGKQIGQTTTSISALSGGVSTNTITVSGEMNVPANKTMRVKVLGNLSTGASDGDGTADTIITNIAASGVSGSGATSGTTVAAPTAAEITANATVATSATTTVVEGGTLSVAVETSGAASSQFVTTGASGFEMARIKLTSTIEDMKLEQIVLRTVNGSTNLASAKLLGTGMASDPSTQVTSGNAVFSFPVGSEITVPANSTRVLTVQVSTTGLQTLVAGNLGVLGFGTMNARGAGSGVVVQERLTGTNEVAGTNVFAGAVGDIVYFTNTAAAGTNTAPGYYMVTTIGSTTLTTAGSLVLNSGATGTSFTSGDVVTTLTEVFTDPTLASLSTAVSVGDLVFFHDASTPANSGFYTVGTAAAAADDLTNAANELGLSGGPADLSAVTYVTATDMLTKVSNANGLTGNTMRFEEVEPVITSKTFTQESQGSEVTVAKFEVKADGTRDMTFNSLTLEKSGNNSPERLVTRFKLYDGTTLLSEVVTTAVSGTSGAAITTTTAASLEICTGAATAVADEIGAVSAAEYAKWAVGDRIVLRQSTGTEITGTITTKGAITAGGCTALIDTGDNLTLSNITGTSHTAADAMTINNFDVHFNASQADTGDTALSEQTITQGQTKTLTVKADLNSLRSGLAAGNSATFSMTVPGSAGPLRLTAATAGTTPGDVEGLNWDYTPLGTGTATYKTEGDSYPVTGQGLTY